jgi:hypothetical protein
MIPYLSKNDMVMFYKYLNRAKIYFEYGSGGSTYQASIRDNIKKIYCVESDMNWLNKLKENIKKNNITYLFNEMDSKPGTWGKYGENATDEQKINYSNQMMKLSKKQKAYIDLVFIDGRFRVACCLKCYNIIRDRCFIAFDDFLNREYYHVVLDYFDIIEKTVDNRMVILKKKKNKIVPDELIKKYELIQE